MNQTVKEKLQVSSLFTLFLVWFSLLCVSSWLLPSGAFVFYTLPSPLIRPLSAVCLSDVLKVRLKLDRISRRTQCRLLFLPGSPAASGEAGRLIRDTAETTERLKHTWRHETGRAVWGAVCACVCVWFYFMWFEMLDKDSLELSVCLSGCVSVYRWLKPINRHMTTPNRWKVSERTNPTQSSF